MISVIGTGPGSRMMLTRQAENAIDRAEFLVGWPRLLALFPDFIGERMEMSGSIDLMLDWLRCNKRRRVAVLASGDPMLFGIGKCIADAIEPEYRECLPGISSVQLLFSELGLAMNDVFITSSHGKQPNFDFLFAHSKVALVTDKSIGPYQLAQQAMIRDLRCTFIIGERLGYADQRISIVPPHKVEMEYDMNVVVILNERQ